MGALNQMNLWEMPKAQAQAALMAEGERRRDAAIAVVEQHANPEWSSVAYHIGTMLAASRLTFTAADIDLEMMRTRKELRTSDKRAFGPVIRRLASAGVLRITNVVVKDPRPHCHAKPCRVLHSLMYETDATTTTHTN